MTSVLRYLTGFFSADTFQPGLIQKLDGTVWLVNPDGSETQVGTGGGPVTVEDIDAESSADGQVITSNGDGTADWEDAAASTPLSRITLDLSIVNIPVGIARWVLNTLFDPTETTTLEITTPPLLFASGNISVSPDLLLNDVPDLGDSLDFEYSLYVTDATGANTLVLTASSSSGTPFSGVTLNFLGVDATIVGADLTWDSGSGTIATTAGGAYSVSAVANLSED